MLIDRIDTIHQMPGSTAVDVAIIDKLNEVIDELNRLSEIMDGLDQEELPRKVYDLTDRVNALEGENLPTRVMNLES